MTLIFGFKFKLPGLLVKYTKAKDIKTHNLQCFKHGTLPLVIHSGDSAEFGKSHLEQWIPVFKRANISFFILVRNIPLYNYCVQRWSDVPCAYARLVEDVDKVLEYLSTNGRVFYLSNTGNSSSILRRNDLQHIFLGHGDSNKFASAHKFFRVYDEIWVASDAHLDRFKNANFETRHLVLKKIGRPMLKELIHINRKEEWKERIPRIALYAPTWEGVEECNNGSSVKASKEIIQTLLNYGFHVRVKFHPATGKRLKNYLKIENEIKKIALKNIEKISLYSKESSLYSLMVNCAFCIGDNSGVITDFLSCNCPIAIYKSNDNVVTSKANTSYSEFCYEWLTLQDFEEIVKEIAKGNDNKTQNRRLAEEYYLGLSITENELFFQMLNTNNVIEK